MMRIIYRVERRIMLIEPDSLLMIVNYGLRMWLLFRIGA
jgi:cation:H+ antiporter